jgi:DNA-binding IscR family transcriptional regulator
MKNRRIVDSRAGHTLVPDYLMDEGVIASIGPYATVIYLYLMRHARTGQSPTVERISTQTGISDRQVYRAVRGLISAGLVRIDSRGNQHIGSNIYRLLPPPDQVRVDQVAEKNEESWEVVFEKAWTAYPKRPGHSKKSAMKAFHARVKEGVDPLDILKGVDAYRKYCEANGTTGVYIKMASTFFGPDHHFASDYATPEGQATTQHDPKQGSKQELLSYYQKEEMV